MLATALANAEQEVTAQQGGFGTFNVTAVDSNTLRAAGKANTWKRKIVLIQRQPARGGRWVTVAKDRTNQFGRFSARLHARSDIPCTGTRYKLRAKKKGRPQAKVDDQVWSCS